jgi:threonine dehydratase
MILLDILRARQRIAPYVRRTPLVASTWLSDAAGSPVSLKLESLQVSSSFKSRGAFNAVIARLERAGATRPRLVTASAGNHGRALAAAAEIFGLQLTVFAPADAARVKLSAIRRHGADLQSDAIDYDAAELQAKAFARETGAEFISAYSDVDVIAGAGTVALEILEDAPDTRAFVVPIGGGGLISGIATAVKEIDPSIEVTGVEVEASRPFQTSVNAGRMVRIVPGPTLADGLCGNPDPETITFAVIQQLVDRIVTVTEPALYSAICGLVESEHVVAEGAGAAAAAAVESGILDLAGRRAAVVVSGGNIDRSRFASVIQK